MIAPGAIAAADIAIDVAGLSKSFGGRQVVRELTMRVKRGTIYGFIGPNGAGKTTTIRLLCGLLTPDAGRGTCLGFDIRTATDAIKRQVGYMTQRFSLYQDLSVRENLEFVARIHGLADPVGATQTMMARLGLDARRDQLARSLSGGWKQRLSLAACVLPEPQLLLLDEPTAGVDPTARREFWSEIHAFAASGLTVLVSTHYMDEAERCHEISYIANGAVMLQGTVDAVVRRCALTTFVISGDGLAVLAAELAGIPGVGSVTPFGPDLHVCGHNGKTIEDALAVHTVGRRLAWRQIATSLEDVLINHMAGAGEPRQ
jgi:ABC-2 type transport system ATP-binding protein